MTTTPQELFEINQTDIKHLFRQMSDISSELARMKKVFRLDEKEDGIKEDDKYNDILLFMQQTSSNLVEITRIMKADKYTSVLDDASYFNNKRRTDIEKQGKILENEIRNLSNMEKKMLDFCPENKEHNHKGIQFIDSNGNVVCEMCPVVWWRRMAFLRFWEGTLKKFREEFPFDGYMKRFSI